MRAEQVMMNISILELVTLMLTNHSPGTILISQSQSLLVMCTNPLQNYIGLVVSSYIIFRFLFSKKGLRIDKLTYLILFILHGTTVAFPTLGLSDAWLADRSVRYYRITSQATVLPAKLCE